MGRTDPSYAPLAQQAFRKDQRAKHARATISKTIPQLLSSDARARKGIENAELFSDNRHQGISSTFKASGKVQKSDKHVRETVMKHITGRKKGDSTSPDSSLLDRSEPIRIRIQVADTLIAAQSLHKSSRSKKNIAILNMASPLRPGGGVLNGATSQEESLCSRTTLLPSLKEEWYRLPEVGAIWSPDVLVFRLPGSREDQDLPRSHRFYVDVVSAAMNRFPDVVEHTVARHELDGDADEAHNTTIKTYAGQKDRDLALDKMRAILDVLKSQKSEGVVLGAWGCGAYGNPINEICDAWKRAILGTKSRKSKRREHSIDPGSIKEIVFAIKDRRMAEDFAQAWGDDIEVEQAERSDQAASAANLQEEHVEELMQKIATIEMQMEQVNSPVLRQGLEETLYTLKQVLAKADVEHDTDEEEPDDTEGRERL